MTYAHLAAGTRAAILIGSIFRERDVHNVWQEVVKIVCGVWMGTDLVADVTSLSEDDPSSFLSTRHLTFVAANSVLNKSEAFFMGRAGKVIFGLLH